MRKEIVILFYDKENQARIAQHAQNVYSLTLLRPYPRNRWGTLQEIIEDAQHFLTYGVLPREKNRLW